ncbi:DUF6082 family protein [Actinomadura litoris]|uniref:DUF6082 family protein n=1 Tax=Actinomadura litoris TaxID=2678616 RepID=UPI001FEB641B|nr:DUF6082 family protein [Actinomadura litoris]
MPSARPMRRTAKVVSVSFGVLLIVGLIGASPWALRAFDGSAASWERLSFIGQTYGAASALLAVLALIGIVATLVLQARDTRIAREETRRAAIAELLKMAMDDPDLDEAWGPVPEGESRKARRQLMYINMIVSEWQTSFQTGALNERRLRAISREMFTGRPGRAFWREAREVRANTSENKRARRFHQILDEEFQQAPVPPPDPAEASARHRNWPLVAGAVTGSLVLLPFVRWMLRRR